MTVLSLNSPDILPQADVYLVGGPSGAGKTLLGTSLATTLDGILLGLDHYFVNESNVRTSRSIRFGRGNQWDHPESVDLPLAAQCIQQLRAECRTVVPVYSFFENRRIGGTAVQCKKGQVIIVEGIHALRLRSMIGQPPKVCSIFLDAEVDVRRQRVSVRDAELRGRPLDGFERRFHFMRIAEKKWIAPQRWDADVCIDTTDGKWCIVRSGHHDKRRQ